MMMDKYLKKALNSLGLSFENDSVKTMDDLKAKVKDYENRKTNLQDSIIELEQMIIDCKDLIQNLDENLNLLDSVEHQIKVEKFKELNKGNTRIKDVF